MNTASAVSAASCLPSSEAPACTITGQPCTGRAMLSGPRTLRYLPLWFEHMHLGRIEIQARFDVAHEGVVGEGIPQARDHVVEFARPLVALGVLHVVIKPEIQRRVRIGGGDDVPAGAAAADMVERGEAAGDVIGLVEGGRAGGDQADMFGDGRPAPTAA